MSPKFSLLHVFVCRCDVFTAVRKLRAQRQGMIQELVSFLVVLKMSLKHLYFVGSTGCVQSKKHCANCVTGAAAAVAVGIHDFKFSEKIPERIYHDQAQMDKRFGLDKLKPSQHFCIIKITTSERSSGCIVYTLGMVSEMKFTQWPRY